MNFLRFNGIHSKYLIYLSILVSFFIQACSSSSSQQKKDDFSTKREDMVKNQIEARGVEDDKVLSAMRKVGRHLFVPEYEKNSAYSDAPLSIGEGQTISQPYIVALMTEMLKLKSNEKVLEIGTGSGYQSAILAEICDSVFTIEIKESLATAANKLHKRLGYNNIFIRVGDGYKGWPEHAPFNGIIVTCAPTHVPEALVSQLAEGGRMVIPVGEENKQELLLFQKRNGKIEKTETRPVRFVPMINEEGELY